MSRVALVTGGTRGIGAAISVALKEAGYTVAANFAGNEEAAAKFTGETGIKTFKWSVADYEACAAGIQSVEAELGPIDILIKSRFLRSMVKKVSSHRPTIQPQKLVILALRKRWHRKVRGPISRSTRSARAISRLGEPEEIARCVTFLVSDDAGFVTGSTITANGGQFFV